MSLNKKACELINLGELLHEKLNLVISDLDNKIAGGGSKTKKEIVAKPVRNQTDMKQPSLDDVHDAVRQLANAEKVSLIKKISNNYLQVIIVFSHIATILLIISALYYGNKGFDYYIDSSYPGLNECYAKSSSKNTFFHSFFKALGFNSGQACLLIQNKYTDDMNRLNAWVAGIITAGYCGSVGIEINHIKHTEKRNEVRTKGSKYIKAVILPPVALSAGIYDGIRDIVEDFLRMIFFIESKKNELSPGSNSSERKKRENFI